MIKQLFLNDLLQLSPEDLNRAKIKFNQHDGEIGQMEAYLRNPDYVNNGWLFWRR